MERLCALQQNDEVLLVLPRYIGNEEWEGSILLLLARFITAMHDDDAMAAVMIMFLSSLISHYGCSVDNCNARRCSSS